MFRIGGTRIVFSRRKRVYKIGRVRPIKLLIRLIKIQISSNSRYRFFRRYGQNLFMSCWRYLFVGYYSNIRESRYCLESLDKRTVDVHKLCWFGWLLITELVEPAPKKPEDLYAWYVDLPGAKYPRDFGQKNGKVIILDIGDPESVTALTQNL